MKVDYDGACWLAEFSAADGQAQAERLDAAEVGFMMWHDGDRVTIFANAPLANARVFTGTMVDGIGSELLGRGAFLCGPWVEDPPEPWCHEFEFDVLEDVT